MWKRWCLAIVLAAGTAGAAPSARAAPAGPEAATASAQVTASAEQRVAAADAAAGRLGTARAQLAARYAEQTAAVDRIKQEKPSWRRDRELRAALADAADTANQLGAIARDASAAQARLAQARREAVAAIDAELAAGAVAPRVTQLAAARARLAGSTPGSHKIVIPNSDLDPLADPEDLDKEAGALRQTEGELQQQVDELDRQRSALEQTAAARKEHDRAVRLAVRDDDEPHHTAPRGDRGAADSASATGGQAHDGGDLGTVPTASGGASGASDGVGSRGGGFEADASIVLADVVDGATLDGLSRAQSSGDPGQRAAAAQHARDAVAARLAQLRARRAAIEARASQLRKK